jgi:hypothetical protein
LRAELLPNAVLWAIPTCVIVNKERTVGLEHQEPNRFRKSGRETTGVLDLAASDE